MGKISILIHISYEAGGGEAKRDKNVTHGYQ